MADILLAEDTESIRDGIAAVLTCEFHTVRSYIDGATAYTGYRRQRPDLMIIDLMMPVMNGFELLEEVRRTDASTPILILSAKSTEQDKVLGLEQGADDYLCKPFGVQELIARVNALLRRSGQRPRSGIREEPFEFGGGAVDPVDHVFTTCRGRHVLLSRTEVRFLRALSLCPNRIISRKEIFEKVWECGYLATSRTLDTHVWRLRQKLGSVADHIATVPTLGFRYTP